MKRSVRISLLAGLSVIFLSLTACKEKIEIPVVITYAPEEALTTTAKLAGEVTSAGGGTIAASGICWSTSNDPDINDNVTTAGIVTGKFTSPISGLSANNTYYYRAYATNEAGTSYGDEYILVTSIGTVTDFEGNTYNTIKIGTQTWMRENLRSTKYSDGTVISGTFTPPDPNVNGLLYTWQAALRNSSSSNLTPSGIQGACPAGWHIPSNGEFGQLELSIGVPSEQINIIGNYRGTDHGNQLKEAGSQHWGNGNPGSNSTGFTGLPSGAWYNGSYLATGSDGIMGLWWTTSIPGANPVTHSLIGSAGSIWVGATITANSSNGASIRCIKD